MLSEEVVPFGRTIIPEFSEEKISVIQMVIQGCLFGNKLNNGWLFYVVEFKKLGCQEYCNRFVKLYIIYVPLLTIVAFLSLPAKFNLSLNAKFCRYSRLFLLPRSLSFKCISVVCSSSCWFWDNFLHRIDFVISFGIMVIMMKTMKKTRLELMMKNHEEDQVEIDVDVDVRHTCIVDIFSAIRVVFSFSVWKLSLQIASPTWLWWWWWC